MDFKTFLSINNKIVTIGVENSLNEIKSLTRKICERHGFIGKLSKDKSVVFIKELQPGIENHLKEIISKHSVIYWLKLFRKVPPGLYYGITESISTTLFILKTFNLAIHKYGKQKIITKEIIYKKEYSFADYSDIKDLFDAYRSSYEFYSTTSAFRRINKGARLVIESDYTYLTPATSDLEEMMYLYDVRSEQYCNIFDTNGSFYIETLDKVRLREALNNKDHLPLIIFSYYFLSHTNDKIDIKLSYLSLKNLKKTFSLWYKMNIVIKGLTIFEILAFLGALTTYVWKDWKDPRDFKKTLNSMLNEGFTEHSINDFYKEFYENYENILVNVFDLQIIPECTSPKIEKLIELFSSNSNISLTTRNPSPLIVFVDNKVIIDWVQIPQIFRYWTDELNESEKSAIGSISGNFFQEELRQFLIENLYEFNFESLKRSKLFIEDKPVGEIDIGLIIGNILFLIEAKIKMLNTSYITGESKKETVLWQHAQESLKQVDNTAKCLANGALNEKGKGLPLNVKYIIPLVCTPLVMFIKQKDAHYFLTNGIPRICTPQELILFIKNFNKLNINEKIVVSINS